jgi:hypothetical protein
VVGAWDGIHIPRAVWIPSIRSRSDRYRSGLHNRAASSLHLGSTKVEVGYCKCLSPCKTTNDEHSVKLNSFLGLLELSDVSFFVRMQPRGSS